MLEGVVKSAHLATSEMLSHGEAAFKDRHPIVMRRELKEFFQVEHVNASRKSSEHVAINAQLVLTT